MTVLTPKYPDEYTKGFFIPDPRWVCENLLSVEFVNRAVLVHKACAGTLSAIDGMLYVNWPKAYNYINTVLSWSPRHMLRSPARAFSMHAYGLALDINPETNSYGSCGDMDPTIVELFQQHGWVWGGDWKIPDPMHFEYPKKLAGV